MKTDVATRETKNLSFQVKALGISTNAQGQEIGIIEAYGAVFNNIDDGNDKILKGSFIRTINNSKSRAEARKSPYILKMLWQHKTDEVIGSWSDVSEDNFGLKCTGDVLLATQRGKEYYELAKAGMLDEFSIIYDVMPGGSTYDKSGVRELSELRLFSIDPVTFPMNDETYLVGVKALSAKGVCGNTSGAIGPRDEAWNGSKAEKQIWTAAEKEDGTITASVAKKYFMSCDGDGSKKGDYSYPFWYVGSDPHICVGAVKAIAGAIQGSRGADAPSGLKSKVETLYNRINKKYPDDPQLSPPWKDDSGKSLGRHMDRKDKEKKTIAEHYAEETCKDLLKDWADVYLKIITQSVLDALKIGDQIEQDIGQALDDWKEVVLSKFLAQAIECDLPGYISDNSDTYTYSSADSTMLYGSGSRYGYMSNEQDREEKAGKPISAANQKIIDDHVKSLRDTTDEASKAVKSMQDHVKALRTAADDLATRMQGAETPYTGNDPGTPDPGQQEGKGNDQVIPSEKAHDTQERPSEEDTVNEKDLELMLSLVQGLKTAV